MDFQDFEIKIGKGPAGYRASVLLSHHDFQSPFQPGELDLLLARAGVRRECRDLGPSEKSSGDALRDLGTRLFGAVFAEGIRREWDRLQGQAQHSKSVIRLCLLLEDPEIWEWPWEYLCDPNGDYLSFSRIAILRGLAPLQKSLPPKTDSLRVLVVSSHPKNTANLSFKHEWEWLTASLRKLSKSRRIVIKRIEHATLSLLREELKQAWDVLHFIGHGTFNRRSSEGVLLFERENGERYEVSGRKLSRILRRQPQPPKLIVLNACEGGRAAENDAFAGVSQRLVKDGAASVVAMQFKVSDRAALFFSRAFYTALAEGDPVDQAVYEGRQALHSEAFEAEWGNPVLYTRFPDLRLVKHCWICKMVAVLALLGVFSAGAYWASTLQDTHPACPSPPGLDMPFVKIPDGVVMRSGQGPLKIEEPYCMAKFEATQGQWRQVMGELPKQSKEGDNLPVGNVSKADVGEFLAVLNQRDPGARYRLPTDAEWEYGARAGTRGEYSFEGDEDDLYRYGNCASKRVEDGFDGPAEIGSLEPNPWGLHDMYGNHAEWVADEWPAPSPAADTTALKIIRRGGSFRSSPENCDSTNQSRIHPDRSDMDTGFRVIRDCVRSMKN